MHVRVYVHSNYVHNVAGGKVCMNVYMYEYVHTKAHNIRKYTCMCMCKHMQEERVKHLGHQRTLAHAHTHTRTHKQTHTQTGTHRRGATRTQKHRNTQPQAQTVINPATKR